MATIQVADGGATIIMEALLNGNPIPDPIHYHLYSNDFSPTPASVIGDFTESTASGYSAQNVNLSGWSPVVVTSGHTKYVNTDAGYTITGAASFFGYFVTDDGGNLLWSRRFDTTIVFSSLGGVIALTPTFEIVSPLS